MQNPKALWASCQNFFKQSLDAEVYDKWFSLVTLKSFNPSTNTLTLCVPSLYVSEYIEKEHVDLLRTAIIGTFGKIQSLQWFATVVDKNATSPSSKRKGGSTTIEGEVDALTPDYKASDAAAASAMHAPGTPDQQLTEIDSQLNARQTFRNFVEGDSNKLCRSVGINIAEHPQGTQFNPLFIYGPSGCGKTHLVNAIGLRCKELYPEKRVLYVSARTFQVQFTNARLKNNINDFIAFYQTIDMLIIDDVQEWMSAPKTQETFFHIFNHLFRLAKRIVLVSDRPPVQLEGMMTRLITRFSCGLVAELEKPNIQLCIDILHRKIARDGLVVPEDVVRYIAENANGSVRDLQGVINSMMAYSIVDNCNIDMRLVERILKRSMKINDQVLTIDDIIHVVCDHFNVTEVAVKGRTRKREIVVPRQIIMYLADKHMRMPASRIGRQIGGRDHSTVLHSLQLVSTRLTSDAEFRSQMIEIEQKLGIDA
ncbi:MAG: chromosomal replication initiator protein DnaA [Prevotella sp.]|nr:chromosomal replication initiator protein DnaA [Prevotella sp.]